MSIRALPSIPSELIRLGLGDLRKVERDPRYVVEMWTWHEPDEQGECCSVCMAGAVMAQTLGLPWERAIGLSLEEFGPDAEAKLHAIDDFRMGEPECALGRLGIDDDDLIDAISGGLEALGRPPTYDRGDPGPFHAAMERMAAFLEERDL